MKTCFKCGQSKPLNEFYAHPRCRQGTLNKCKQCTKIDVGLHYHRMMQDPAWIAQERERQRIKERARRAAGKQSPSRAEDKNAWRKRNPQKANAQTRVRRAVKSGALKRKPCQICGSASSQAHHDDYSQPLDVRWLCVKHHNEHHVRVRLIELGVAA
jgi:ribosomal protein S27AE